MAAVFSVAQVRELERRWAAQHNDSTWGLMVSAAQSFVRQFLQPLSTGLVLVVVGNGNNGGDGYVIARLLREAGVSVDLIAPLGKPAEGIDAYRARAEYLAAGGVVLASEPAKEYAAIIDALFGIGLSRPIEGDLATLIERLNRHPANVYAVDIPSGLCADTGRILGVSVLADACHTFIGLKPGLLTHTGPEVCGQLSLDTLGIDSETDWQQDYAITPLPSRSGNTHKAQHGDVRVVGGRLHMAGAAIIAGRAALNSGTGRVFVHGEDGLAAQALAAAPELMIAPGFNQSLHRAGSVYVVGPGLGLDDTAGHWLKAVLELQHVRGVLDADALTLLSQAPQAVPGWVLTPHEGEAARLLGVSAADVQQDRVAAATSLTQKYGATIVLKGAGTLVASGGKLVFCHPGSPAMSSPGMGDCLSGVIGSLLAQGLDAGIAAVRGVNWHASIGASLAKQQRVVLASDVIDELRFKIDSR